MSFEGMDVDEAQRLAQQLDANAQALARITAALGGLAQELSYCWRGPASAAFQYQWTANYQAALNTAAQALSDTHARLVANIGQQTQASASYAGSAGFTAGTALTAILGGIGSGWAALQVGAGWVGLVQTPLDQIRDFGGAADDPYLQQAAEFLGNGDPGATLGVVDTAAGGLGDLVVGADTASALYDLHEQHYASAVGNAVDATSTALMNTDDPVTMLAGFDIALLKKDYELAQQINWREGIPNPFNASNFMNDYVPTFESLPGQLVSTLAGIL